MWPKGELFLAGPTRKIPSVQGGSILPARVANQNTGFASSSPLTVGVCTAKRGRNSETRGIRK